MAKRLSQKVGTPGCASGHTALDRHRPSCPCHQHGLQRPASPSLVQRRPDRTTCCEVFCHPHTGNVLDPSKMRKHFGEAIMRAGVREITFHELRHTFDTQMAAAGAPLRAIQEWMGHADAKTTEIYRHYAPDTTNGAQLVSGPSVQPSRRRRGESQMREQAR